MRADNVLQYLLTEILNKFRMETIGISVRIKFKRLNSAYFEMHNDTKNEFWIAVSDEFKDEAIDLDVLTGGIVHEICHIVLAHEQNLFFNLLSIISMHYRKLEEYYLDIMAINKGYFNSLIALAMYIEKDLDGDSWDPDMGMTPHNLYNLKEKIPR